MRRRYRSITLLALVVLLPVLGHGSWAQPGKKPKPGKTRTVTGTVTEADTNTPLASATVTVHGTALTATTAADGTFSIANVSAGDVVLDVSAADHVAAPVVAPAGQNAVTAALAKVAPPPRTVTGLVKDDRSEEHTSE